jgi:DNA-binding transcriptional regulator YdaS (Cro superfamily)
LNGIERSITFVLTAPSRLSYVVLMNNLILEKAIATMGSQTALAKAIGKSQGHISKWLERKYVPAESVLAIESATGIPRQKIRPDLYPEDPQSTSLSNDSDSSKDTTKRKSIIGCMKGMVTFPPDFNPAEPFWSEHEDWDNYTIGGLDEK